MNVPDSYTDGISSDRHFLLTGKQFQIIAINLVYNPNPLQIIFINSGAGAQFRLFNVRKLKLPILIKTGLI